MSGMGELSSPSPGAVEAGRWDAHVFDAWASVQPGHYRPAHQPLARIEALAAARGVDPPGAGPAIVSMAPTTA